MRVFIIASIFISLLFLPSCSSDKSESSNESSGKSESVDKFEIEEGAENVLVKWENISGYSFGQKISIGFSMVPWRITYSSGDRSSGIRFRIISSEDNFDTFNYESLLGIDFQLSREEAVKFIEFIRRLKEMKIKDLDEGVSYYVFTATFKDVKFRKSRESIKFDTYGINAGMESWNVIQQTHLDELAEGLKISIGKYDDLMRAKPAVNL